MKKLIVIAALVFAAYHFRGHYMGFFMDGAVPEGEHAEEIYDSTFETEVLDAKVPVLVDFWAPWCGPCRKIAPTVNALAYEYRGRVKVCKINIDYNKVAAEAYKVNGIPTLILYHRGAEVGRITGATSKDAYRALIERAL